MWSDVVTTSLVSADADRWFSNFLGRPVELVRTTGTDSHRRPLSQKYFDSSSTKFNVAAPFADGYPMLLLGAASVDELNYRIPQPSGRIPAASFRPNIVVGGSTAWDEDTWSRVRVGSVEMALVKPCSRCQVCS